MHQCYHEGDQYGSPNKFGHIYAGVGAQSIEDVLHPISEVHPFKSKAKKRPEQGSRFKPHLVLDEMHEGAKGEDEKPGFAPVLVEVKASKSAESKK